MSGISSRLTTKARKQVEDMVSGDVEPSLTTELLNLFTVWADRYNRGLLDSPGLILLNKIRRLLVENGASEDLLDELWDFPGADDVREVIERQLNES